MYVILWGRSTEIVCLEQIIKFLLYTITGKKVSLKKLRLVEFTVLGKASRSPLLLLCLVIYFMKARILSPL